MKNSLNLKDRLIIDGQKTGLNGYPRIQHYFGNDSLWARSKPHNLRGFRTRFLS